LMPRQTLVGMRDLKNPYVISTLIFMLTQLVYNSLIFCASCFLAIIKNIFDTEIIFIFFIKC